MAKRWVLALGIIVVSCLWAQGAAARAVFTCTGGHLYVDVQLSDGTWWCHQTTTSCSGEWNFEVARASIPPSPGVKYSRGVSQKRALEVLRIASELGTPDVRLTHRVSDTVWASYRRRGKLQPQGTITLSARRLSRWMLTMLSGTVPTGALARGSCPGDLYPNGSNCYPCLGCHPCGDTYCDNGAARLTPADLSPDLARRGYKVVKGRIKPPSATQ